MDIIKSRTKENLKMLVTNHILPGTNITHDVWPEFIFLDEDDRVYTHETHIHGHGDFWYRKIGNLLHQTSINSGNN